MHACTQARAHTPSHLCSTLQVLFRMSNLRLHIVYLLFTQAHTHTQISPTNITHIHTHTHTHKPRTHTLTQTSRARTHSRTHAHTNNNTYTHTSNTHIKHTQLFIHTACIKAINTQYICKLNLKCANKPGEKGCRFKHAPL